MGIQPPPLDDLLSCSVTFTKLQEVLGQLIAGINEQDNAIKGIREDIAKNDGAVQQRLAGQDAAVALLAPELESSRTRLSSLEAAVAEAAEKLEKGGTTDMSAVDAMLQERLKGLDDRLTAGLAPLEQRFASFDAQVAEAKAKADAAAATAQAADVKASSADAAVKDSTGSSVQAEAAMQAQQALSAQLQAQLQEQSSASAELLAKVAALDEVPQSLAELSAKVAGMAELDEQCKSASEQLKQLESGVLERLKSLEERTTSAPGAEDFKASIEEAKLEAKRLGDELEALGIQVRNGEAKHLDDVKRLDDGLRSVQGDSGTRLLVERLGKDLAALTRRLDALSGELSKFLGKGAAAVSQCLCCHTKAPGLENKIMVGTDGKTYFRSAGGRLTDLGRINAPLPANVIVPARRRQLSPVRGGMAKTALSYSAGAL